MLSLEASTKVYLLLRATDMRKGSDSLSRVVEEHFDRSSLDGSVYVFISRDKKKVKLLYWERDGHWLCYKRLETSTFRVKLRENGTEELTGVNLRELLRGVDLKRIKLEQKVEQHLSKK